MLRTLAWIAVLVLGGLAVLIAIIFYNPKVAVAVGIVVIGLWIAFGAVISHWFGITRHVVRHLGRRWHRGHVLRERIRTGERVNIQTALNLLRLSDDAEGSLFGFPVSNYRTGPTDLVALLRENPEPAPLTWENLPHASGATMGCANNALYLLRCSGKPACVMVQDRPRDEWRPADLQVLAHDRETAQATLDEIYRLARENSPYRGSVLSIDRRDRKSDDLAVLFHDLEPVDRNEIILPEQVLETLERNVLGYLEHAGALRQAGHGTRHGVLLHGPPGTGKTLVTRYLAQVARGATVILITGRQYAHLRSALQLARLLAPSLVILEDVDLIAMERRQNRHAPLLHELMDEMDGMGSASDCIFILTTNRPGVLEPALSARPGRVDQAIAFPLPDAARRRQLCEQFGRELHLDGVNQEALIARTEGASPAFLKELFRRATLLALERGHMEPPVLVQEQDFQQALRELVEFGGDLTRQFLGFPVDSPRAQALR